MRVEQPRDAAVEAAACRLCIDGGGYGGRGVRQCLFALFAQIFCQCVAAQRYADGVYFTVTRGERVQSKGDFGGIAQVVKHRGGVRYAAAAAEMDDYAVPTPIAYREHQFDRVMAATAALQTVKQHDQRRIGRNAV